MLTIWIILACSLLYSQDFAPIGAKWYYSNRENPLGGSQQGYLLVESEKDTLIIGKAAKLLRNTYYSSIGDTLDLGYDIVYSENNQVFYIKNNRSFLLYNFNPALGDTLKFRDPDLSNISADTTILMIVESVDSLKAGTTYLKRINLRNYQGHWDLYTTHIERIGNIPYLYPQTSLQCDAACYDPLRCYLDEELSYSSVVWSDKCDMLITSISAYGNQKGIRLYPNPTSSYTTIEMDHSLGRINSVNVINLLGQEFLIESWNLGATKVNLNVSHLRSGYYIIEINENYKSILLVE